MVSKNTKKCYSFWGSTSMSNIEHGKRPKEIKKIAAC